MSGSKLDWKLLLNATRRKTRHRGGQGGRSTGGRQELERDYDRILYATPTRRMAKKTQVFPLDSNDSVRTRLTHSHEVSTLARSIGTRLVFDYAGQVFGDNAIALEAERNVPALLAAIGLAHDLGNPPFGHQGERAIRAWFKDHAGLFDGGPHADFLRFDGNAQTFRLLTRLQMLNDRFGLNLTYGTLAALLKYPQTAAHPVARGYDKFGVFESERDIAEEVWRETGLSAGIRHPLTHIMEACDDIAYSVLDAEDIVKKGIASFYDLLDHLQGHSADSLVNELLEFSRGQNRQYRREPMDSRELSDISMQTFRVKAISLMAETITREFVGQIDVIMHADSARGFSLLQSSAIKPLLSALKQFDRSYGYLHPSVQRLDIEATQRLHRLMSVLWSGIDSEGQEDLLARYSYNRLSANYRRVYRMNDRQPLPYCKAQLLCDMVSGMTDPYMLSLHDELLALKNV